MTKRTDKLKSLARHMSAEITETPAQQQDRHIPSQQEVDEAIAQAEEMNQNMRLYGTIDAPKNLHSRLMLSSDKRDVETLKLVDALRALLDTIMETRGTSAYQATENARAIIEPYFRHTPQPQDLAAAFGMPEHVRIIKRPSENFSINCPQQRWSGKPGDIIQTALFAGQEMMLVVEDTGLVRLSYMSIICQGFHSVEEAKQAAPGFARSVITHMLSMIEDTP